MLAYVAQVYGIGFDVVEGHPGGHVPDTSKMPWVFASPRVPACRSRRGISSDGGIASKKCCAEYQTFYHRGEQLSGFKQTNTKEFRELIEKIEAVAKANHKKFHALCHTTPQSYWRPAFRRSTSRDGSATQSRPLRSTCMVMTYPTMIRRWLRRPGNYTDSNENRPVSPLGNWPKF